MLDVPAAEDGVAGVVVTGAAGVVVDGLVAAAAAVLPRLYVTTPLPAMTAAPGSSQPKPAAAVFEVTSVLPWLTPSSVTVWTKRLRSFTKRWAAGS